jgi:FkbM family methyltransferase
VLRLKGTGSLTIASRLGVHLPERLLVRLVSVAYRRFEPEIRRLGELTGAAGGTMVDVGSWYGPWARRLARRADRVVCMEPTPLHKILQRTLPAGVEVIAAAASDHAGEAEMWLSAEHGAVQGVSSLHKRDIHHASIKVPLVTIDSLGLHNVTFMKIDVEGHEVAVLNGAADTIKRDRPRLFVEVEQRVQPVSEVIGLLAMWGYDGWVRPGRRWLPLTGFDLVGSQAKTCHAAERGLLRRALWPYPRYVNSVLFLPDGQQP